MAGAALKALRTQLWFQVLVAMALGLAAGLILSPTGGGLLSEAAVRKSAPWIALPGNVFLALIKTVVIPLVFCSIVLGLVSSPDPKFLRKAAVRIFPYFIGTTAVAIAIGISLTLAIKPGRHVDSAMLAGITGDSPAAGTVATTLGDEDVHVADRIVAMIPSNYVRSVLDQDMLATVVLALMVGLALMAVTQQSQGTLTRLLDAVQDVCLVIIGGAMRIAPIAVFALICTITMKVGFGAIAGMAAYIGTVLLGLMLLMGFYLLIVRFLAGVPVGRFLRGVREVQLLAFSTSSSAAVMPVSMRAAEQQLGVNPSVARFIVPLGATINMDGTALYQVTAAVFLTQVFGIEMTTGALLALAATAVGASIGTPSTPGVGIVVLATILEGVGVPASGIALIIGVDRILDMSRTTLNVTGDLTACTVMNRWLRMDHPPAAGAEPSPAVGLDGLAQHQVA